MVVIKVKQTLTHTCELTLPNTKNPFLIMADGSTMGVIEAGADQVGGGGGGRPSMY